MTEEENTIITGITGEFFDRVVAPAEIGQKVRSCLQCGTCTASCPEARFSERSPREIVRLVVTGGEEEVMRPEVLYCRPATPARSGAPWGSA